MLKQPPKISIPKETKWSFYLEADSETTIWFLESITKFSRRFLPVKISPSTSENSSITPMMMENEKLSLPDRGDRYFWSRESQKLTVQRNLLRDYSKNEEIEQLEFEGNPLTLRARRGSETLPVRLLPDRDEVELYRIDLRKN